MRDRQTCVGCGKKSPETETNYTLISAQFGWRLTRYKSSDGALIVEWRCPTCWRDYKRSRTAPVDDAPPSRPSQPPSPTQPPPHASPPRPPAPFESFRVRAPSSTGDLGARRPITPVIPPPTRRPTPAQAPAAEPTRPPPRPPPRGTR